MDDKKTWKRIGRIVNQLVRRANEFDELLRRPLTARGIPTGIKAIDISKSVNRSADEILRNPPKVPVLK